jgi:hypothetical protein
MDEDRTQNYVRNGFYGAFIDQSAVVRQILDHLGIALPSSAYRSPPVRIRLRRTDSYGEAARGLAVSEAPERTYEPVEDDLPLHDPMTI